MIDLNDVKTLRALDKGGVLHVIGQMPDQLRQGWAGAPPLDLPARYRAVTRILIAGMGGSAIGGDLLRVLMADRCRLPLVVNREYALPAWVDENTLVIASSYSGSTEETLQSYADARGRGAAVVALTTGGRLQEVAQADGTPVLIFPQAASPRAALGYSFVSLVSLLAQLELIPYPADEVQETVGLLARLVACWREDVPEQNNPAKTLARRLGGYLPAVFGTSPFNIVARRWKSQFNENSKTWAIWDELPEADHNSVVGIDFPPAVLARLFVIFLAARQEDRRSAIRRQVTAEVFSEAGITCEHVVAEGDSLMAQVFSLVLFGDYVSCYLALMQGTDPTPITAIERLKARLAELGRESG